VCQNAAQVRKKIKKIIFSNSKLHTAEKPLFYRIGQNFQAMRERRIEIAFRL